MENDLFIIKKEIKDNDDQGDQLVKSFKTRVEKNESSTLQPILELFKDHVEVKKEITNGETLKREIINDNKDFKKMGKAALNPDYIELPKLEITDVYLENGEVKEEFEDQQEQFEESKEHNDHFNSNGDNDLNGMIKMENKLYIERPELEIFDDHAVKQEINDEEEFQKIVGKTVKERNAIRRAVLGFGLHYLNRSGELKCHLCGNIFKTDRTLQRHLQIVHSDERPYKCEICNKRFKVKTTLKSHSLVHEDLIPLKCNICNLYFRHKGTLKIHMEKHSNKIYSCDKCDKTFDCGKNLSRHKQVHKTGRPFSCQECNKKFKTKATLRNHRASHDDVQVLCSVCGVFTKRNSLAAHQMTHSDLKPFNCNVCNSAFKLKHLLKEHMNIHFDVRKYKCDKCDKSFKLKVTLVQHMKFHSNVKPYVCSVCKKSFTLKHQLSNHMNVHGKKSTKRNSKSNTRK